MFNLVADIKAYPQFIPWCYSTQICSRVQKDDHIILDTNMVISFKLFREKIRSCVRLYESKHIIRIEYIDGPLEYMNSSWDFLEHTDGCLVTYSVDYEFKTRVLRAIMSLVFGEAIHHIVGSFERRANEIY